ncbi:MAG: ArsR family transcriptional regulator [Chloroflexota bacterium]
MDTSLHFLKLLAHEVRWLLLTKLAESDRRVQELVTLLKRPQNLISYHLRLLREGNIVVERQSSADGRDTYYSLNLSALQKQYQASGIALHPALAVAANQPPSKPEPANQRKRPFRILFLCTHNSARSQLAEGMLRAVSNNTIAAFSAGSKPSRIHPLAKWAAAQQGISLETQSSKDMAQFANQQFDYVITVCDQVREVCPVFPDGVHQIHWSLPDPTVVNGSDEEKRAAFAETAVSIAQRVHYLHLRLAQTT